MKFETLSKIFLESARLVCLCGGREEAFENMLTSAARYTLLNRRGTAREVLLFTTVRVRVGTAEYTRAT